MKILIVGKTSRIANRLVNHLSGEDIIFTTREGKCEEDIVFDLTSGKVFEDSYDAIIYCAFNFKRGRYDYEQAERHYENVAGTTKSISKIKEGHIIYLSSYLAEYDTAYGRQKKEIEDWIKNNIESHSILRIGRIVTEDDYDTVCREIKECIYDKSIKYKEIELDEGCSCNACV